jgi:hypothetical protein
MVLQDELYSISLHLPCREYLNLSMTNHYNYNYFNQWKYLTKRDFNYIDYTMYDKKEHYKKIHIANYLAISTIDLFTQTYIEYGFYRIFIHPLRNINRYDWLPSYFNEITKSEPTIELIIDNEFIINVFASDPEWLYDGLKVSSKMMIECLTKLFYKDPRIKFVTYKESIKPKLIENYEFRHNHLNRF